MSNCKFHPELYDRYSKKDGHRIKSPAYGQEIKCPTCGTMVTLGKPHPPGGRRGSKGYIGHLMLPIPPTRKRDLDRSGWVKEELLVNDDNNPRLWAAIARRPKKNEPMQYSLNGQIIINEDHSQTLYDQVVYDINEDGRQASGTVFIGKLNSEYFVIKLSGTTWQITSEGDYHD